MLMYFDTIKGHLYSDTVVAKNEKEADALINTKGFNCKEICQILTSKKEGNMPVKLKKDELGNWFFYEVDTNSTPIVIVSDEDFTDRDLWYCIGNNKEQLRHLLFLYRKNVRKDNTYTLLKKTAGDALAS